MINKIKSRKDFIRIQRNGKKVVSSCLIVQYLKSIDDENPTRFGFTASKKVGGAVSVSYTHLTLPTTPYV